MVGKEGCGMNLSASLSSWEPIRHQMRLRFDTLFQKPELPAMEYETVAILTAWLEDYGFHVTRGAGGLPTAFVARLGQGTGPRIGILAEYDALPGLANAAEAGRAALPSRAGHACGHNHIGPTNCGAAIAAALTAAEEGLAGEIIVYGTPAEEIGWGKIAMLDADVFSDCDILLTSHGDYQNGALSRPCTAYVSGEYIFTGETAHGGKRTVRNAQRAAEDALRQIEDKLTERFPKVTHRHVFRAAGLCPGVTPDAVRLWFNARAPEVEMAAAAQAYAGEICAEVAKVANVGLRFQLIAGSRGYLANDVLGRLLRDKLDRIGPPQWSEADIAFMEALSAAVEPGAPLRLHRTLDYFDTGSDYYGQDDGELSWRIPLGRVNWAYPDNVPIHHWAWTALSGHAASTPGPMMAFEALAEATLALLRDGSLVTAAKAELATRVAGRDLGPLFLGARTTLRQRPQDFWDATWIEDSDESLVLSS